MRTTIMMKVLMPKTLGFFVYVLFFIFLAHWPSISVFISPLMKISNFFAMESPILSLISSLVVLLVFACLLI